jgi:hypothetical protein
MRLKGGDIETVDILSMKQSCGYFVFINVKTKHSPTLTPGSIHVTAL